MQTLCTLCGERTHLYLFDCDHIMESLCVSASLSVSISGGDSGHLFTTAATPTKSLVQQQ